MRQIKISKSITNRDAHSLERYLQEISRIPLLAPHEEEQLALRMKRGDTYAMEKLINSNLRFVVSVAKQYQNQGLSLQDLINEGNLGLMKAAFRFDHSKGFKFISYAVWWIRQSILHALADQGRIVRIPLNKLGLSNKISKAYQQLEQEFEREPSADELAEMLHVSPSEVAEHFIATNRHISVDAPVADGEEFTLLDIVENPNAENTDRLLEYHESLQKEISISLQTLTQRQKEVICYIYGIGIDEPLSIEDISRKFNLTRERVRQIKDAALSRLKSHKRCKMLKVYLG